MQQGPTSLVQGKNTPMGTDIRERSVTVVLNANNQYNIY